MVSPEKRGGAPRLASAPRSFSSPLQQMVDAVQRDVEEQRAAGVGQNDAPVAGVGPTGHTGTVSEVAGPTTPGQDEQAGQDAALLSQREGNGSRGQQQVEHGDAAGAGQGQGIG